MNWQLYSALWAMITLVAGWDACFAWLNADSFFFWETNPIARGAATRFGVGPVVAFRLLSVLLVATLLPFAGWWARTTATWMLFVAHGYLGIVYLLMAMDR
jgi:hypothetical protein